MAKLSEIYKVGMSADDVSKITNKNNGGGDSAPASYVPGKKLSDYYTPGMSAPTPKPVTRSTAVPSIAQSQTTSSQPTFDYEAIIKEYESLPSTNIFSRLFNKESEAAYNRKQELNSQYEQAKDIQTVKKLNSLGALDDVKKLWDTYEGHDEVYTPLYDLLKSKGVTDKKELNDLVNNIEAMQKREGIERANKYLTEYADEHPVLGSALTVPTKMVTGLGSVAETGMNYVAGKPMSNASSVSLSGNKAANEMRNVVSDDMNGVGKFLYGSGMSMADMLANRWILGGLGNVGMGAEKYADTVNEAIDQGLNPTQIVGKGLASGATTYITNKMLTTKSLDAAKESILDLLKEGGLKALGKGGIVKVLLPILAKTGVAEGTQEGLENIADTIADAFIAGGKNELTQSYNQYKANGLSDSEALKKVAGDKALELLQDTAGGFLSGFLMGGAEMGKSGIEYKLNNRNNQSNLPGLNQPKNNAEVPTIQNTQQTEQTTAPTENEVSVSPTFADDVAKIRKTLGDDVNKARDWSNQYAIDFKDSLETLKKTPTVQNYDNAVKALDAYEANLPEGVNVDTNLRDALNNLSAEFGIEQNATSVDKISTTSYNNGANGAVVNERGANNDASIIQPRIGETSSRVGDSALQGSSRVDESQGILGQRDNRISELSPVKGITPEMRTQLTEGGVRDVGLKYTNDAVAFSQALDEGRKLENNDHGVFVSAKSPQEVQEILDNGGVALLSDDRLAGCLVTADGDIEGVFYNKGLAEKLGKPKGGAFFDLMANAIAHGGKKLDCYGDALAHMYAMIGMEPVVGSKYIPNKPWSAEMDAWKANQANTKGGKPEDFNTDVYVFKLRDGWTVDDVIQAIKTRSLKEYANSLDYSLDAVNKNVPSEVFNVKEDDVYDSTLAYRNSLLEPNAKESATSKELPGLNKIMKEDTGISKEKTKILPAVTDKSNKIEASAKDFVSSSRKEASQFAKTLEQNESFKTEKGKEMFKKMLNDGTLDKETKSNAQAGIEAYENIDRDGIEKRKEIIENSKTETTSTQLIEADIIGAEEVRNAIETGDTTSMSKFFGRLTQRVSDLGRALQAVKLFKDTATQTILGTHLLQNSAGKSLENRAKKKPNSKAGKTMRGIESAAKQLSDITPKENTTTENKPLNRKLANALNQLANGKKETTERQPKTHEQIRQEVVNTLEKMAPHKEWKDQRSEWTEQQIDAITSFVESGNVDVDTLAQEMKSVLATNAFFTLDESTPLKPQKGNSKLQAAIDLLTNGRTEKEHKEKNPAQVRREVEATLGADVDSFSDAGIEFLTMLANDPSISKEVMADEIEHYMNTGEFYTIDESTKVNKPKSSKLAKALNMNVESKMNTKTEARPKSFNTILEEVNNTLEDEGASVEFSDNAKQFLATLLEEKVDTQTIADEINHYLEHGTFFTIDESTNVPKPKSSKLLKALNLRVENKIKTPTETKPKSFNTILEEVNNTLDDEDASVFFSDSAKEFIATLIDERVDAQTIADEIDHYLENGSFYTLDESIDVPKPTSQRLQSILNEMGNDTPVQEKAPLTYDQIRERVKNTLDNEMSKVDFTDDEISYMARLMEQGATSEDIKQALIRKVTTKHFEMSPEDMKSIVELCEMADKAPTSKESANFKQQAAAIAAKYAPEATFMDKWNNWRITSMLLSIPTHVRNFAGNLNWGAVTNIKDAVGAVLEEAIIKDGGTRTKALLNKKRDADLINASREDFSNTVYEELTDSSKFTMKNAIERQRRIYKTNWLEKLRTANGGLLEKEDVWALERKYTKALARYLKANGYGAEVFKTNAPILDEARSYAIQAAKDSTFHADNALAKTLETWSRTARENGNFGLEVFIESNVPFKKTPVNIAVQGLRYTPGVGLIPKVAGTNVFQDIFSSQKNVNAFIDVLARQLTGGAIMAFGAGLAAKGWLVSDRDEDEDDAFKKGSNYSIKFGDKSFTIDWLAPAALPLFIGAELYHAFSPNDDPKEDKKFFTALASLTEPIVETSMLQGLDNTLNSLINAGKYKFPTLATNIVSGYASQALPTSLGQLARTIDPYRRTTRTATSNSVNPPLAALEKAGLKALNKLPGLSMLNEPYLDAWGEPQKNANGVFGGNVFGRAVQNFLLPGYFNDTSMTPREEKLATLEKTYEGTGSLIPSLADDNSPNGRRLSNSEYTRWAQVRGGELKKAVDSATAYKGKIPTSDLQDYVHELELFANVVARNKQFGTPIPKTYKKKYEAYKDGGYSYSAVMKYLIENSK